MSLGGGADEALDEAVRKAIASGVTFAVAAGNDSADAGSGFPRAVKEAITVASSTKSDEPVRVSPTSAASWTFTRRAADITSTWHNSDERSREVGSGTSMAAPHVVGAAALYLAGHKDATPAQVASKLINGATPDKITNPGDEYPQQTAEGHRVADPAQRSSCRRAHLWARRPRRCAERVSELGARLRHCFSDHVEARS